MLVCGKTLLAMEFHVRGATGAI
ncbi:MAG: hypothetical protein PHI13_04290 [Methylococcales bacterium]|nr:hypothetical protein [Methylococcales bacterium]